MSEEVKTQGVNNRKLRPLIEKVRNRIRNHPVVIKLFEDHGLDPDEIDLVPMCFADLDVSARTDHGVIYFNTKLLEDGDFEGDDHYMVHELTHWAQQTTGSKPTKGSDDASYLDNPAEKEGFQNQSEYIAETQGEDEAEEYINQVMDHHDVKGKEREKRIDELLKLQES